MASAFFSARRSRRNVAGCRNYIIHETARAHLRGGDAARRALQHRGRSLSLRFLLPLRGPARSSADRHFDCRAKPSPEKSSRISLAQNTKNGSRSSVKRATNCSPLSWIRKNGSASCTRTPVTKPSKRSSRADGNRNAPAEFSGFLPNPTYFSFSIKNIDSMDSFFRALLH